MWKAAIYVTAVAAAVSSLSINLRSSPLVQVLNAPRVDVAQIFSRCGLRVMQDDAFKHEEPSAVYMYSTATSCFTCRSSPPPPGFPRHISAIVSEEALLRDKGWGFLDSDDSEPAVAFDVDEYNKKMEYTPAPVMIDKELLRDLPELTRSVLLDGETEEPWRKITSNAVSFTGSFEEITGKPGTFLVAGVPIFTTEQLTRSTPTSPWLSFSAPLPGRVTMREDADGMRMEALYEGLHLGHYFAADGAGSESYCINAAALTFSPRSLSTVLLGGGCFWGVQEALSRIPGVVDATAGYAGDDAVQNPCYKDLKKDNALVEVVAVEFDASVVKLERLVELFLTLHDPSKFRAAGNRGPKGRYRSFIASIEVRAVHSAIDAFKVQALDGADVATEVVQRSEFTRAEARHQHYHGMKEALGLDEWLLKYGRKGKAVLSSANSVNVIAGD